MENNQEGVCEFYPLEGAVCDCGSDISGEFICTAEYSQGCQWAVERRLSKQGQEFWPLHKKPSSSKQEPSRSTSLEEASIPPKNHLPLHLTLEAPDIPEGISEKLSLQEQARHHAEIAKINKQLFSLSHEAQVYREILYSLYRRITNHHNRKHQLQAELLSPIPRTRVGEKNPLDKVSPEQLALLKNLAEEIIRARDTQKGDT